MSKIEIGYGHDTYAYLAECATCGKPYHQDGNWRTAHTFNKERNIVIWLLYCEDCWENLAVVGE